jgi:hypothetical protein
MRCRVLSRPRALVIFAAASTVAALVLAAPAAAALEKPYSPGHPSRASVPVGTVKAKSPKRSQTTGNNVTSLPRSVLPAGGSGSVAVSGTTTAIGGIGIRLSPASADLKVGSARSLATPGTPPSSLAVQVLAPSSASALGVRGVLMTLRRGDAAASSGQVHASFDTSSFANVYGADFGDRLRLVAVPACALTTPSRRVCQTETDLGSTDVGGLVSADLTVPAAVATSGAAASAPAGSVSAPQPMVVALTSTSSDAGATYSATSLSPSYSWSAGNQGGTFTTSYPLDVPAGLGGPEPDLHLDYDSGAVDGQTLAQNGQTSWAGEGWDLQTGFIEESFRSCSQDGGTTADLCQFSPYNATMVFQGQSVRLVRDNTTHVWHTSDDSALKVDEILGSGAANAPGTNGTQDHRYWRVTTQDGTQYYFGINYRYAGDTAQTLSTQTEPVFGNNSGEQCYNATFANAWCQVGYRWNLDYVVDPSGNSMTYSYVPFTGHVGINNNTKVEPYVIQDTLAEIDYGTRAGSEATQTAPMKVLLGKYPRCFHSVAICDANENGTDWPDTPWDLYCSSSTSCPNTETPVYFDPYSLDTVTTQVLVSGTTYRNVDLWNLAYTFPSSGDYIAPAGDDTAPNLWLNTITHTGYAPDGTSLAEPAVTFGGTRMANRVDWGDDIGVAPYMHYRLTTISNGTGGETDIAYSGVPCTRTDSETIDAANNSKLCFPQYFKPAIAPAGWGWFNKYTVTSVTDRDLTGGSPDEIWSYAYSAAGSSTGVLWHHDYTETVPFAYRSWSQFNGFSTVTVTHGAAGGPQTVTNSLYYRGMDGDGLPSADGTSMVWNARRVTITDSQGSGIVDADGMQGQLLEQTQMDGATVNSSTIHSYADTQTADRGPASSGNQDMYAYMVTNTKDQTRTWLPLTSTWRWTETDTSYNSYGLPTQVKDLGDTSTSSDDNCTATSYVTPDTTKWLIDFPSQTITTDCAASPGDADYLSGTQTFYDGSTSLGATPTVGLPTKTTALASVGAGAQTFAPDNATGYDSYGRVTASFDASATKPTPPTHPQQAARSRPQPSPTPKVGPPPPTSTRATAAPPPPWMSTARSPPTRTTHSAG